MLVVKNPPANAGDERDMGSIPGLGRYPGIGNGHPLRCSCLENSMQRASWQSTVHWGHKESDTTERLSTSKFYPWLWAFWVHSPSHFFSVYISSFLRRMRSHFNKSLSFHFVPLPKMVTHLPPQEPSHKPCTQQMAGLPLHHGQVQGHEMSFQVAYFAIKQPPLKCP